MYNQRMWIENVDTLTEQHDCPDYNYTNRYKTFNKIYYIIEQ